MEDYEPINVIKQDKRYIVISGHERVVALMVRGFKRIKARVYDMNRKK
jgi:ParB-like chromosome segregation protein Spo0J